MDAVRARGGRRRGLAAGALLAAVGLATGCAVHVGAQDRCISETEGVSQRTASKVCVGGVGAFDLVYRCFELRDRSGNLAPVGSKLSFTFNADHTDSKGLAVADSWTVAGCAGRPTD